MTSPLTRCYRAVLFAVVVGSLSAGAATASAQSRPSRVKNPQVVAEAINTSRPVSNSPSGSVGLAMIGGKPSDPAALYAYLPAPGGRFQLNVTATDGRLVATIEFDASSGTRAGWEPIELPSRTEDSRKERNKLLAEYFRVDSPLLAFALFSKDQQFTGQTQVLWPVASKDMGDALSTVKTAVLIKSGGSQTVVLQEYVTRKEPNTNPKLGSAVPCTRVKEREPFYYDTYCETTLGALAKGIRVTRFLDDQTLDPIEVQVPGLKAP